HPLLFRPKAAESAGQLLSDATLRPSMPEADGKTVEVAMTDTAVDVAALPTVEAVPSDPIRILITRRGARDAVLDLQTLLTGLGYDAGTPDGVAGSQTHGAIRAFQAAEGLAEDGMLTPELVAAVYARAGRGTPPNGRILVRQKFKPVFEAPVTIREPARALGTHFLLARNVDAATGSVDWFAAAMANHLSDATKQRLGIADTAGEADTPSLQQALDRIEIADEVKERVSRLLSEGASLTIADAGVEAETGLGTDFITITRKTPKADIPMAQGDNRTRKTKTSAVVIVN
ncbi:peptidoglycan-binding protein, partial [Rhizobium sp. TRM95111]|uniref:peptidoglycan-binding protein n=1 Tax=Rhizobium alarense TaxID=2846851 RepID=UPI001F16ED07